MTISKNMLKEFKFIRVCTWCTTKLVGYDQKKNVSNYFCWKIMDIFSLIDRTVTSNVCLLVSGISYDLSIVVYNEAIQLKNKLGKTLSLCLMRWCWITVTLTTAPRWGPRKPRNLDDFAVLCLIDFRIFWFNTSFITVVTVIAILTINIELKTFLYLNWFHTDVKSCIYN